MEKNLNRAKVIEIAPWELEKLRVYPKHIGAIIQGGEGKYGILRRLRM